MKAGSQLPSIPAEGGTWRYPTPTPRDCTLQNAAPTGEAEGEAPAAAEAPLAAQLHLVHGMKQIFANRGCGEGLGHCRHRSPEATVSSDEEPGLFCVSIKWT